MIPPAHPPVSVPALDTGNQIDRGFYKGFFRSLFQWSIVVPIAAAWTTQEFNLMDWHVWCGYAILTLLLFRRDLGFRRQRHRHGL